MAQRHPTSRRRPREGQSEPDDVFVSGVFTVSEWARRNTTTLVLFGLAVAAVLLLGLYYVRARADQRQAAVQQLEAIQQGVALADPTASRAELGAYIERFDGTPWADEARLVLGQLHLEADEPQQAVSVLEDADLSPRHPLGLQIRELLAKAHEAGGSLEAAEEGFLEVAERAELDFQRVNALADAARVRARRGDHAGAAELYERILEGMEPSDQGRGLYEMRLEEARVQAATS